MFRQILISCLLLIFLSGNLIAQSDSGALRSQLDTAKGTDKVDVLNKLSRFYWYSDPYKSIGYGQEALALALEVEYSKGMAIAYNNMGVVYKNQGEYPKALEYHYEALKLRQAMGDEDGVAASSSNLGAVYQHQGNYVESLKYYEQCLVIDEKSGVADYIASTLGSIGNVYSLKGDFDKALDYHKRSLEVGKQSGKESRIATAQNNIGETFSKQGDHIRAANHLQKSLALYEKLDDQDGITTAANNLANVYLATQNLNQAAASAERALEIAKEMGLKPKISSTAETLYKIHERRRDYQKALAYHKLHKAYQDSVLNEESNIRASSIAFSFELEKKEAEITLLETDKKLEQERAASRNLMLYATLVALVLMGGLVVVFFMGKQKQKRAKERLGQANEEISQQSQEIQTQNEELHQQQQEILAINEKLSEQSDKLEEAFQDISDKNELLTGSIRAAERMQNVLLPRPQWFDYYFPQGHFVIFKPRDIVSGDFYWLEQVGNKRVLVEADCTGHGVPGALMSMMGVNLLNRMVLQNQMESPDEILESLHEEIVRLLNPEETGSVEGMDMTIAVFGEKTAEGQEVLWASAKQSGYVLRKSGGIEMLTGTRRNIGGISRKKAPFQVHQLQLQTGDRLILASDGYADQNNPQRKKIGGQVFKDLLEESFELPIHQQRDFLESTLHQFMEGEEQRDDIVVVAVEV